MTEAIRSVSARGQVSPDGAEHHRQLPRAGQASQLKE